MGPAAWQLPPAGLLISNRPAVGEPSRLAATLPSDGKVTVVAVFGVTPKTALGEPSSLTRVWIAAPDTASVTDQPVPGGATTICSRRLLRSASARAVCRPLSRPSLAARSCWFCSHEARDGRPSM